MDNNEKTSEKITKWLLVGISVLFLAVMLLLPLITVITEALRSGWKVYAAAVTDEYTIKALLLTVKATLFAVVFNTVFGVFAAWALTKFQFRGKKLLTTLIDLPVTISPVIAGLIFLLIFGRQSPVYFFLMNLGIKVVFSVPGIIIATVFVAFGATMATYVGQNRGAGKMDRVKAGMKYTQIMILIWSVITMIIMFFFGKYMTWLFIDKSQTDVINVSVTYFHTVFWAYPFLGSIFLYRNGLQGLGYGLVPMLGGVFELAARSAIVMFVAGKTSFAGVCLADPAAWIAALIPLIPYYIYVMKKWSRGKKETAA